MPRRWKDAVKSVCQSLSSENVVLCPSRATRRMREVLLFFSCLGNPAASFELLLVQLIVEIELFHKCPNLDVARRVAFIWLGHRKRPSLCGSASVGNDNFFGRTF